MVRHVDRTSASVWVEVGHEADVSVRAVGRTWSTHTFAAHGHHYALVEVDGLEPGTLSRYEVAVDGTRAWPPEESPYPDSVIATLGPDRPLRLAFGSCRTSVSNDAAGHSSHGVDALRTYALRMAEESLSDDDPRHWPHLLALLGDQVYADETTEEMRAFIESRRDIDEEPGTELKDYQEYAHLYELAWGDPAIRWLFSTLPSLMIFDDHDIRDDWNTSAAWRKEMEATSWWLQRVVSGLGSYWVYQHLGNMSADERSEDEIWRAIAPYASRGEELDISDQLDAFAERVDRDPTSYRWSIAREAGDCRLVLVDSRAARDFRDGRRRMLDEGETAWLDDQLRGDCEHLLVATSLPFLLAPGLQYAEAWSEALADGAWGGLGQRVGERLRRAGDLEHWGAFQDDFARVLAMVMEVAEGKRGQAPRTVTFLSGDVHHSYLAEVDGPPEACPVLQVVCSPMRNPLSMWTRYLTAAGAYGVATPIGALAARSTKVPDPAYRWRLHGKPHFDNNIATIEVTEDGYDLVWETGVVLDDDHEHPVLRRITGGHVRGRAPSPDSAG